MVNKSTTQNCVSLDLMQLHSLLKELHISHMPVPDIKGTENTDLNKKSL